MPETSLPPPPAVPPEVQRAIQAARDEDHLRLLEIGFYISGVLTALRFLWFGVIALLFTFGGVATLFAKIPNNQNGPPPSFILFFFAIVFATVLLLTLVFAALEIYAGICLKQRRHPVLIQIVAALYCISIPWGTALGIFTFMVLNRPTVKTLFSGLRA